MPIGGSGQVVPYDARNIRWGENGGYIFENPSQVNLHSVFPHPISLVDSYVSFDLIIPSYSDLMDAVHTYANTIHANKPLVCLTGFNTPIIEFIFSHVNQNETLMRIRVAGNDGDSHIDLNIGYDEAHHFDIILKDYTAEIIMDNETLEFSNDDEPISIVPVSNEQSYIFIGTSYFSQFMYTLSGIHIETDTYLANSEIYDINYWLGEFESAYNEE